MSGINSHMFARQLDFVDVSKLPRLAKIGYGGVGSTICMYLAKMGVTDFTLWDPDHVMPHNISNQMFANTSVGHLKVDAAEEEIRRYSPTPISVNVTKHAERFDAETVLDRHPLVISSLDSIAARREVWESLKWEKPALYIDARMGGETAKVYTVFTDSGDDVRFYESSLTQKEFVLPCTAQAIAYNAGLIASIVCSMVKRWVNGSRIPRLVMGDSHNLTLTSIYRDA